MQKQVYGEYMEERISMYILFRYRPNKSNIFGFFDEDDGQIYINEDLGKTHREFVYVHESQHRTCYKVGCKCWNKKTEFLCEYHAFRAEFRFALNKNSRRYWTAYFKGVIMELDKFRSNKVRSWRAHFKALSKVCRFKQFQCIRI